MVERILQTLSITKQAVKVSMGHVHVARMQEGQSAINVLVFCCKQYTLCHNGDNGNGLEYFCFFCLVKERHSLHTLSM